MPLTLGHSIREIGNGWIRQMRTLMWIHSGSSSCGLEPSLRNIVSNWSIHHAKSEPDILLDETLLRQAAISSFPKVEAYNLDYLQKWLSHPSCGNFPLIGPDHTIWKETPPHDLLALRICPSSDPFSRWAINSFMPRYHRFIGHHFRKPDPGSQSEYVEYNSRKIARTASIISAILAAVILIAPVVILYEISSMRARLGIMAGFTVVFSLCMAGLTNARRSDIFAATAA